MTRRAHGRARSRTFWLVAPVVGAVLFVLAVQKAYLPPDNALLRAEARVACPFASVTGIRCPFCGLTTSMALALRGELRAATSAHPLGPAAVLLAVWCVLAGRWRGRKCEAREEWSLEVLKS